MLVLNKQLTIMEFASTFVFLIAVVMAMAIAIAYYLSLLQGCCQFYIDWLAWLLSQSLFACMLLHYNVGAVLILPLA